MWWTFAAAFVGSLTALFIAFFVYPFQKREDRALQIQLEQRRQYLDAIRALMKADRALEELTFDDSDTLNNSLNDWFRQVRSFEDEITLLAVSADVDIAQAAADCLEVVKTLQRSMQEALGAALDQNSDAVPKVEIIKLFQVKRLEAAEHRDEALSKLIEVIRSKAFDLDGKFKFESRTRRNKKE